MSETTSSSSSPEEQQENSPDTEKQAKKADTEVGQSKTYVYLSVILLIVIASIYALMNISKNQRQDLRSAFNALASPDKIANAAKAGNLKSIWSRLGRKRQNFLGTEIEAEYLLTYAGLSMQIGEWDKAIKDYDRFLKKNPKSPFAPVTRLNKAKCLANKKEYSVCLVLCEKELRKIKTDSGAAALEKDFLRLKGIACLETEQKPKALKAFRKVKSILEGEKIELDGLPQPTDYQGFYRNFLMKNALDGEITKMDIYIKKAKTGKLIEETSIDKKSETKKTTEKSEAKTEKKTKAKKTVVKKTEKTE